MRPSEAKPHPTLQRVGDSLGEASFWLTSYLPVSKLTETPIPSMHTLTQD